MGPGKDVKASMHRIMPGGRPQNPGMHTLLNALENRASRRFLEEAGGLAWAQRMASDCRKVYINYSDARLPCS